MPKKKPPVPVLPARPEPPTLEQIQGDLQHVTAGDVVYTMIKKIFEESGSNDTEVSGLMDVSDESCAAGTPTVSPNTISQPSQQQHSEDMDTDVSEFYNKVIQFIELSKDLRAAPETLKAYYEELQKMGGRLSEAINELKSQVESTGVQAPCR
ncbi:uncharacterized protein LOC106152446 [Lingula anatina]|uniref:Uncharacterized protein LOC106152446 n=1 Tax=Lingula anatina TaxID=7574 RepID=A0A1S3H8M7_LINAN|nr:uncharacterized protein LOC106152446 [Lingula anatina]|eukprot:XP_013381484.1 uncharacterized protein LOC106152446 [Lingula anatina]